MSDKTRENLIRRIEDSSLTERLNTATVIRERVVAPLTPGGSHYRIIVTDEVDQYEKPLRTEELSEAAFEKVRQRGENFTGTARRAAKISIANAPIEEFDDLTSLIDTFPSIDEMRDHVPHITTGKNSNRVAEEQRNVRVRVWIYAMSREDDNDFHLILGRAPGADPLYMTMELSGLPPANSPHFAKLKAAREAFKTGLNNDTPGTGYEFPEPPIPVEIEGSLFFDMSHINPGSRPGPSKLRQHMPTICEVHPISKIVLEPD